jgi:TonB-dependent receptor
MTLANPANQSLTQQSSDTIFSEKNIGVHGFLMDELTNENDRYDASENVGALYAMGDVPFGQLRVIAGVRYEHTLTRLNSAYIGGGKVNYVREYNDVLPSLNFIYALTDQMNLRAAASQTVSRPEFREIAPFSFYDFDLSSLVQGDTIIERSVVRNLDFRYEWFPTAGELISFSVFHKQFGLNGFMGLGDTSQFEGGAIEATVAGSNNIRSWANSSKPAINYGIEFEIRKNLGFIVDDLTVFLLTFNYSRTFSEVDVSDITLGFQKTRPMQGQSPYTVNVGLLYSHPSWGTSVNALYNTFGKRLVEVNPYSGNIFEYPRNVIDLSISQPLFERFELKFSIRDVLAERQYFSNEEFDVSKASTYDFTQDPSIQKSSIYDKYNLKGASYSLSVSVKL